MLTLGIVRAAVDYHWRRSNSTRALDILNAAANAINGANGDVAAIAGPGLTNEDAFALAELIGAKGNNKLGAWVQPYTGMDLVAQVGVGKGTNLGQLGKGDAVLIIASDIEEEAHVWRLRLKQAHDRSAWISVANARHTRMADFASCVDSFPVGGAAAWMNDLINQEVGAPMVQWSPAPGGTMKKIDDQVAAKAKAQFGMISRAQAIALGMSASAIEHRRKSKRWMKESEHVYRLAGVPDSDHQRILAACLALGPAAVASHATAAYLWGLDGFTRTLPKPIEVTVPHGVVRRLKGVDVHQRRDLSADAARFGEIPTTSLERTLVDLATHGNLVQLERAFDAAWRRKPEFPKSLEKYVNDLGASGRAGIHALLALARLRQARPTESAHEVDVLRELRRVRLPPPTLQHEIFDEQGKFVARPDFAWVNERVVLFADGWGFHHDRASFDRDHEQRERLAGLGWTPVAVTPRLLKQGAWVAALTRHLRRVA